jgi:DNA-binding response OmpR family regulator
MNIIHLHIIGSKTFTSLLSELNLNYSISSGNNLKYNNKNFFVRIVAVEGIQQIDLKKYFLENIPTIFLLNNKDYLIKNVWKRSSELESHAFETHLHRLRKKINKFFKDKEFIIEKNSLYYLSK